eukprot:m.71577 g.71577  ORF g.71577 m.71577 type:complete len:297 (+) comp16086_c0_seq5:308-1198(+)
MGVSTFGGYNGMSRHYLQVIEDAEVIDLASSQDGALHPTCGDSGVYTLRGIDFSEDSGSYPCSCTADGSIIKLPRSPRTPITDGNSAITGMASEYIISFRSDDYLGTYAGNGEKEKVFVHYRAPFHFYADMLVVATLNVGDTFTDADANFAVTYTSIDGTDGKTADITLDFCGSTPHLHSADISCTFKNTGYPCTTSGGVAGTCTHATSIGECTPYSGGNGPNCVATGQSFLNGLYLQSDTTACNGRPLWQQTTGNELSVLIEIHHAMLGQMCILYVCTYIFSDQHVHTHTRTHGR